MAIGPPNSGGFSVAGAGARLNAGQGGVYRKAEFKALLVAADGSPLATLPTLGNDDAGHAVADSVVLFSGITVTKGQLFGFEVECPSARCRVAFGISALSSTPNYDDRGKYVPTGGYAFVNVIPGLKLPGMAPSLSPADFSADQSMVANGQPLYPYDASTGGSEVFDPSSSIIGGYDGTAAHSGGAVTSNGRALPFAYEAISMTTNYRVRAGIFGDVDDEIIAPLFAWAHWEIIDPRDSEDTEALMSQCRLNCNPPIRL